jgi:hypothetical protein
LQPEPKFENDLENINKSIWDQKVKIDPNVIKLIGRKLSPSRSRMMVDSFLYSNLRKTKVFGIDDVIKEIQDTKSQEMQHLKFIMDHMVSAFHVCIFVKYVFM